MEAGLIVYLTGHVTQFIPLGHSLGPNDTVSPVLLETEDCKLAHPIESGSVSDPFHFDADPDPRIRFRDNGSESGSGSRTNSNFFYAVNVCKLV